MNKKKTEFYQNKIKEISPLIFNGDYQKVDSWFEENKDLINIEFARLIHNENYFFSFRSDFSGYDSKKMLEIEKEKRIIATIKHFDLYSQLLILNPIQIDDLSLNLIKHFKRPTNYKKILKTNINFNHFIAKLFFYNSFDTIDKISKELRFNPIDSTTTNFFYFRGDKRNTGFVNIKLLNPELIYKAYLVDRFSEEKLNYLKEKNMINFDLIDLENTFSINIFNSFNAKENDFIKFEIPTITTTFKNNQKQIYYYCLKQSTINNNNLITKNKKI